MSNIFEAITVGAIIAMVISLGTQPPHHIYKSHVKDGPRIVIDSRNRLTQREAEQLVEELAKRVPMRSRFNAASQ